MASTWLVLALAFGLVTAAAGVLWLGMRGEARSDDPPDPPEDDAAP